MHLIIKLLLLVFDTFQMVYWSVNVFFLWIWDELLDFFIYIWIWLAKCWCYTCNIRIWNVIGLIVLFFYELGILHTSICRKEISSITVNIPYSQILRLTDAYVRQRLLSCSNASKWGVMRSRFKIELTIEYNNWSRTTCSARENTGTNTETLFCK